MDASRRTPPGEMTQGRQAHFLERASLAEARAADAGDPEARQIWGDMALIYRQLAVLASRPQAEARKSAVTSIL